MYQFLKSSITNGQNDKIIYYNNHINSAELLQYIDKIADYLSDIGIKSGDVVAIALPNIPEAIIALYAINKIGAIVNLLHPKISPQAMENLIAQTHTKAIFLYDKLYNGIKNAISERKISTILCRVSHFMPPPLKMIVTLGEPHFLKATTFSAILKEKPSLWTENNDVAVRNKSENNSAATGEAPAIYIHSGGTTGVPKTVVHSSRALNALSDAIIATVYQKIPSIMPTASMLMMLPIFHGFGLGVCVHTVMCNFTSVLMPQFKAKSAINLIKKHRITHLAGVPAMFRKMLNCDSFDGEYLGSLQHIFCGGEALSPDLKHDFDAILTKNGSAAELAEGYGLTETASVFSLTRNGEHINAAQGIPLIGNRVLVVDGNMQPLPNGKNGQILLSSVSIMLGYLRDTATTAATFVNINGESWLKTGDIGHINSQGYVCFVERSKRTIKISAINIFPSEVEKCIKQLDFVLDCCIARDSINGKPATKLILQLKKGQALTQAKRQAISNHIKNNLSKYAVPKSIIVVDKFATTPLGKIDYRFYEKD